MNRLEHLRTNLLDMTPDEKAQKIREIREDRRINKHAITTRKKRAIDKTQKFKKGLADLTEEERQALIAQLTAEE